MILQKFETLDSLKMTPPWQILDSKKTPFADFWVKNQTLICPTYISLAIWKCRPSPWEVCELGVKSVQSALSDLKRLPERLQSQCNYQPFIT